MARSETTSLRPARMASRTSSSQTKSSGGSATPADAEGSGTNPGEGAGWPAGGADADAGAGWPAAVGGNPGGRYPRVPRNSSIRLISASAVMIPSAVRAGPDGGRAGAMDPAIPAPAARSKRLATGEISYASLLITNDAARCCPT